MDNGEQEMGNGKRETGNRKRETGNGKWKRETIDSCLTGSYFLEGSDESACRMET